MDPQRAHELMTTIEKDGCAKLIGKDKRKNRKSIKLISEALKHPSKAIKILFHITDMDRKTTFMDESKKH